MKYTFTLFGKPRDSKYKQFFSTWKIAHGQEHEFMEFKEEGEIGSYSLTREYPMSDEEQEKIADIIIYKASKYFTDLEVKISVTT